MPNFDSTETWKPVIGYEAIYSVSDKGRVRRDLGGDRNTRAGRILTSFFILGYPTVALCRDGRARHRAVHILVATAFIGPCPHGQEINHKDCKPANPCVDNLEYVTHRENVHHARRTRVINNACGERHKDAKLTAQQVIEIRQKRKDGIPTQLLAIEYGRPMPTITDVISRKT